MRAWLLAVAASGCSSILGIDDFKLSDDGGPPTDDNPMVDASPDVPAGCLGAGAFAVCLVTQPTQALAITTSAASLVNTDTDTRCLADQPTGWTTTGNQPPACFLVGTTIDVNVPISATGSRPLVLVANDRITLSAGINAAGRLGSSVRAPGAPSSTCLNPTQADDGGTFFSGGGGAGASFMTAGASGGDASSAMGGNAAPALQMAPVRLRAGCNGGDGGRGAGANMRTPAGPGGGAVYLVARTHIQLGGAINVSGAGGDGGDNNSGGGGGGSGGMIVLHATTIDAAANATLVANGGGGGGGSTSAPGQPGTDPNPLQPAQPASGGPGPSPGGAGFAGTNPARPGAAGNGGGGGGGGGGGYIRSNVMVLNVQASPAVTVVP